MARRRRKNDGRAGLIAGAIVFFIFAYANSPELQALVENGLRVAIVTGVLSVFAIIYMRWKPTQSNAVQSKLIIEEAGYEKPQTAETETAVDRGALHLIEERLLEIDWFQFEKLVALIYRSRGYEVKHMGGAKPDGGVDLIVEAAEGPFIVQCKHWRKKNVPVKEVRELAGTMVDKGVSHGIFVTMHGYTEDARMFAERNNIILCDQKYLKTLIDTSPPQDKGRMLELLYSEEKECPKCNGKMYEQAPKDSRKQRSKWRCPRCKYLLYS